MNNIKVFESNSYLSSFMFILYSLLIISLLIYLGFNFKENPVLISILVLLLLFILLVNNTGRVVVYKDKFLIVHKRLLPQLSTENTYRYEEINSIIADLPLTETSHIVTELLPPMFAFISIWNTITINYKNGTTTQLKSKIHQGEYFKAFKAIKSQSRIDITVLGLKK